MHQIEFRFQISLLLIFKGKLDIKDQSNFSGWNDLRKLKKILCSTVLYVLLRQKDGPDYVSKKYYQI